MRRGVGAKRWLGDDLEPCQAWVERTDRNEVQLRIEGNEETGHAAVDVYLTIDECEVLDRLLAAARNETWRRR